MDRASSHFCGAASLLRPAACAAALALVTGCRAADSPAHAPVASPAATAAAVRTLIGDAACDVDAQCKTIGVGAKPCGGPEHYLAWSSLRTDAAALAAAAARQTNADRLQARDSGMLSNCSIVTDPGAHCAAATPAPSSGQQAPRACRLRQAQPGGARPID